jgi:hypothetical protein
MASDRSSRTPETAWHDQKVTRIWFRSGLPLRVIAETLLLTNITADSENQWEWVIGQLGDLEIDITRDHTKSRTKTNTVLFRLDLQPIEASMIETIIERIRPVVARPIYIGELGPGADPEHGGNVPVHQFCQ